MVRGKWVGTAQAYQRGANRCQEVRQCLVSQTAQAAQMAYTTKIYLLTVLGPGSTRSGFQQGLVLGKSSLLGLQMAAIHVSSSVQGWRQRVHLSFPLPPSSYKAINSIRLGLYHLTSFNLSHLLKALISSTVTWEASASTYVFQGSRHNSVHSIWALTTTASEMRTQMLIQRFSVVTVANLFFSSCLLYETSSQLTPAISHVGASGILWTPKVRKDSSSYLGPSPQMSEIHQAIGFQHWLIRITLGMVLNFGMPL